MDAEPGPGETPEGGTGSRLDLDPYEVPAQVRTKNMDELRRRGAGVSLDSALGQVPGVNPTWRYGGFQQIRSRGFRAIILNDGRRDDRAAIVNSHPQGGLWSVDRIEVLQGPAAVLYGFGSVGGVVNIVRKTPTETATYEADFAAGGGGLVQAHTGASGPIAGGLTYRIDAGYTRENNFRNHEMTRLEGAFSLGYSPHPKHRLLLRVGINEDRYNNDSGVPTVETSSGDREVPDEIDLSQRFNTPQDFLNYHRRDFELAYDWRIHDVLKFRQRVSYTRDTYDYFSTEGLAYDPAAAPNEVQRTFYFYFHHHWFPLLSQSEFLLDFLTGPISHKAIVAYEFNAMLGAYSDRASNIFDEDIPPIGLGDEYDPAPQIPIIVDGRLRADMFVHSVFAQDHLSFPLGFNLLVGARYDSFTFEARRDQLDPGTDDVTQRGPVDDRQDHLFSYRAGLVYNGVDRFSPYVSWSTGYRPNSGLGISTDLDGDGRPDFDREPEQAQQIEGGLRFNVAERFSLTAAAYGIWKSNVTYSRPMEQIDTAGRVRSHGLEVDATFEPWSWMRANLGYAWTQAQFVEFEVDGTSLADNAPAFVPPHSANAWLSFGPFAGFGVDVGGRFNGTQYGDNQNLIEMPAYALLDAAVWYERGPLRLTVNGTNLTNETDYFVSAIGNQVTPGAPTVVFGQMNLRF
ncbi:MAG: TonB-dependent receptor [Myxococcales bacterium FL481]|nr:MAG: TonB-dependent receptor [Myxococcales bacterium FL481]